MQLEYPSQPNLPSKNAASELWRRDYVMLKSGYVEETQKNKIGMGTGETGIVCRGKRYDMAGFLSSLLRKYRLAARYPLNENSGLSRTLKFQIYEDRNVMRFGPALAYSLALGGS